MIFHLPEPHIKRATVMSRHMPTGTVRSLQMFLKHSLSFSVFGEERKRAIYHRNWPERRGPWIMYRPYFERAKRHYAKVALIRQESYFLFMKYSKICEHNNDESRESVFE